MLSKNMSLVEIILIGGACFLVYKSVLGIKNKKLKTYVKGRYHRTLTGTMAIFRSLLLLIFGLIIIIGIMLKLWRNY